MPPKRKRVPKVDLQAEFRTGAVQALVTQAISEKVPAAAPRVPSAIVPGVPPWVPPAMLESLTAALCSEEDHVAMGLFMALLSVRRYRFMKSPHAKGFLLMRHDGATYEKQEGPSNMIVSAQRTTRDAVSRLIDLLGPVVVEPEVEEGGDATEEEIQNALRRRAAFLLNCQLGQAQYLRNVRAQMQQIMETDAFYAEQELPTPGEFFGVLDANPTLLGFTNGVMNVMEPGGGMRFYERDQVPADYAVSLRVPFAYEGAPDGEPRDGAQQHQMHEVEAKFRRMFLALPMWDAARHIFGSVVYGGNSAGRAAHPLLGPTSNGKSWAYKFLRSGLGDGYVASFDKTLVIKTTRPPDDSAPTHQLTRIYRVRAAFCSETGEEDEPNDKFKGWLGGDMAIVRPMYGQMYEAPVQAKFFIPSNFPLKHDSNDPAWACPRVGRLRSALSFDTGFRSDVQQDEPLKGIYKADDGNELQRFYEERRHAVLLLILQWAREFAHHGFVLPLTPESVARSRQLAAGSCAGF